MTHPLLDPRVVQAVERAATEHLARAWKHAGFTDLNHRATHPCGIFTGTPFSVFAKLDSSPAGEEQFTAELNGFSLIRSRTDVTTPVPVAGGIEVTSAGTLLVSEALAERGAGSGQAADSRTPGDYAAIGHTLAGLHRARGETVRAGGIRRVLRAAAAVQPARRLGALGRFLRRATGTPMLRSAVDSGHLPAELARGTERVAARLPALCGPDPVPALLHGDAHQNNFVSTADGAVVIDAAPYFGHSKADLALVDCYSPMDPELFRAYAQMAPVDPGFAGRRELWRLHAYLAAIAVAGANAFGRSFLPRLTHGRSGPGGLL